MQAVTTIGLDIAKSIFQVHGVDAEGVLELGKARCIATRLRHAFNESGSTSSSRTQASRHSRTSRGRCGCIGCGLPVPHQGPHVLP